MVHEDVLVNPLSLVVEAERLVHARQVVPARARCQTPLCTPVFYIQ